MRNKYYSGMPQDKYSGIHDGESHRTIPANYDFLFTGPPVKPEFRSWPRANAKNAKQYR